MLRPKSNQVKLQVESGSPVSQMNTVISLFSIEFFSTKSVRVLKNISLTFLPKKEKKGQGSMNQYFPVKIFCQNTPDWL